MISPRRIAPFNAARNTSRIRCNVVADNGRDRVAFARTNAVNAACTFPTLNSDNASPPTLGCR